jgi:hypothetical protein
MALLMKPVCEHCDIAIAETGQTFICTYECTFCAACAEVMHSICPNCGGELVLRPRRK